MVIFEIIAEACCSIGGCNAMIYEESEYCLRHQPSMVSEEETEQEENWWSDGE